MGDEGVEVGGGAYEAEVRWTTHGVAHVRAASWGDLGFGQGWACARDNLPTIADMIVKVRGERARFFGPGTDDGHVASDLGYRALGLRERAAALRASQGPEVAALVSGYVAGCNAWLAEARVQGALPEWCASAPWLRPIDELDHYSYLVDVAAMASARNLVGLIGRAEAPGPDGPAPPSPMSALQAPQAASNGWAFGGDATASGGGLVTANPHFPWYGETRFWECHLTIPGELDVYGTSLIGLPAVQIGFNRGLGWTHTFSCGNRFTLYRLDLVPGAPTRYRFGDEEREMVPTEHTVDVLQADGSVAPCTRTLWSSHHGPMVNLPLLGWGLETAFTYRDANLDNTAMLELFVRMDQATDLDALQAAFTATKAMPWANTLAADASGRAWYTDASATPNLSAGAEQRLRDRLATDPIAALLYSNRVVVLDGSEPDDTWVEEPGARSPGLVPQARLPQLERRDVVVNANDSHWLTHPDAPLDGHSVLVGMERTPRSLRTRQNLRLATALASTGAVTPAGVLGTILEDSGLTAELLREAVVERCRATGKVEVDGVVRDLDAAADVLAGWDGACRLESAGAALWREVLAGFTVQELRDAGPLFAFPFDADDPVATPRDLAPAPTAGPDPVVVAVARALGALEQAGIDPAAPLADVQWAARGDERVPVPGGNEAEGVANVVVPNGNLPAASLVPVPRHPAAVPGRTEHTGLRVGGYHITYGTSFLIAVELTPDGPQGLGLLVYGQSDDPHAASNLDGTRAFADGALRPLLFRDEDIEADPALERRTVRS